MKKRNLKKPIISALEQRILFDGAAVATAVDVLDNSSFSSNASSSSTSNNDATLNSAENSVHDAQAVQGFERPRREVAFVDVTVKDYQTLVDGVEKGTEVYLVNSLDEIKTTLSSQTNIDAIHILSHGNTGEITVGNDVLNSNTLDDNAQLLEIMKNSLSENGDILLYGCNVARDGTGQEFINSIATLTQADVAASDDSTGNSALGGDWILEKSSGSIETDNFEIVAYDGKLVTTTMFDFSTESITGSGTKDSFIIRDSSTHYALKFTTADTSADPWAVFQSLNDGNAGLNTTYTGNYLYISNLSAVGAKITVTADMNNDGVFGDAFKINSFNFSDASFGGGNYVIKPNGIATNQETISVSGLPEDITSFIPTTSSNFDGITSLEIQFSSLASGIIIDNVEIDLPTVVSDTTPPIFDVTPATSNVTATTVDLSASLDEAGKIYYVVVADGATAPSVAQIKAGQDSSGLAALKSGNSDVTTTPFDGTFNITGLSVNTAYDIYVVGQDDEGTPNVMATATKVDVTTAQISTAVGFTGDSGNINSPNATVANGSQSSISITNTATNDTLNISTTGANYFQDTVTTFSNLGITPLSGGTGMLFYADKDTNFTNSITFTIQGNKVFDFNKILLQEINDETDIFTFTPNGDVSKRVTFSFNNTETKLIDLSSNTNFDGITSLTISTIDNQFQASFDNIEVENIRSASDITPPTFDVTPATSNVTSTSLSLNASLDEAGKIYYVVVADGSSAPTVAQIKAGQDSSGASALKSGNSDVTTTPFTGTYNITGLSANTAYDIYVVGQDDEGTPNVMTTATKVDVSTLSPSTYIYYTTNGSSISSPAEINDALRIINIDGTGSTSLVSQLVVIPADLVIDSKTNIAFVMDNSTKSIYKVDLSTNTASLFLDISSQTSSVTATGMAVDSINGYLYYTTTGTSTVSPSETNDALRRINIDGTNNVTLVNNLVGIPGDIVLDQKNNVIFIMDNLTKSIYKVNLSNNTSSLFLDISSQTSSITATGMVIDPINDYLYYTTTGTSTVSPSETNDALRRINLDGTGNITLVNQLVGIPGEISLDLKNNNMYVFDNLTKSIYKVDLSTNTVSLFQDISTQTSSITATGMVISDGTIPTFDSINSIPSDNGTGVNTSANLQLKFSEVIIKGYSGNFVIRDVTSNSVIETISFDDARITGWGTNTLVINPNATFAGNHNISVQWSFGTMQDYYGNFVAANTTDTLYNFTTLLSGPTVSVATGTYNDTVANDTFTNTTGTISATASSGSITGYGISGGTTGGNTDVGGTIYDVSKAGTYGTLYVKSSDGSYVYVPTSNSVINATTSTVTDTFTIQATDGSGTTGNSLTITINGVNDAPVLTAPTSASYTDTSATDTFSNTTGTLSASDRDTGATLSYGISSGTTAGSTLIGGVTYDVSKAGTYGTLYVVSTGADKGKYVYVPTANVINALTANVTDTFTVSSSDGSLSNTQTLTVNITGVNDTPTTADKTITINEDTATLLSVSDFGFSDIDTGSALSSVKITSLASDGTLEYNNGTSWVAVTLNQEISVADITGNKLRFSPSLNENGVTYSTFNFTVNDGTVDSSAKTITYNVTAVNDTPTVSNAIVDQSASVSNVFNFVIPVNSFTDVDTSDTLTYTAQLVDSSGNLVSGGTLPSWLIFNAGTRTFSGTPTISDIGTIYVKVTAIDNGTGTLSVSDTFTITTNSGPTVSVATGTYNDTVANDTFTNTTGTISATASSGSITGYGISGGTTGGNTDVGGTIYDVSKAGTYGTLYVKSSDGSYVYVPTSNSVINATTSTVTDTFTIQATDGSGTTGNSLTITINGVNDAPVLTAPTSASYTDTSATDTFSNTTGTLSASDRDTGATLSYGISSGTTAGSTLIGGVTYDVSKAGTYGTLYVVSTGADKGKYVYVPTANVINALTANVTDTFTVSSSDGSLSNTQTLTVNITGVNDAPTTADKTITINEDTATLLSVSDFGFSDIDTGSALSSVKITSLASDGTLEYNNGTSWVAVTLNQEISVADITGNKLRFSPSLNENGVTYSTFNFTVNDGTVDSSAKTITYNVTAVNDTPTVSNAIVDQSASVSNVFNFVIPVNSFTDVDTSDTLTYTAQLVDSSGNLVSGGTLPSWLIFNAGTRTFSGTPTISDIGTIYVKVTAIDNGTGTLSVSDTFTITTNSGPTVSVATGTYNDTVANDTFTNTTGTISATASSGSITGYGISGGTTGGNTDVGGTIYDVSKAGTYGTLYVKSSDGSYVYVPISNSVINATTSTVTDTFTIQATDGSGTTGNSLTITINGVNDTPIVSNSIVDQTATEDSVYNYQFTSNVFTDVDAADTLTYTAQLVDSNGNLVNSGTLPTWLIFNAGTRTFSGTPANSDVGIIYLKVTATDGTSATTSDIFALTVNNVNDVPVGSVTISGTVTQGETLTASNNITDADGLGTITYQWYADGVLINGATNSTYVLTQNEVNKEITVLASYTDGFGTTETVTSITTIKVANVNDAPTVSLENINSQLSFGDNYTKDISVLFNDIDFDNVFTYEATNLPQGLTIDPSTGVISGKANQSGEFVITIKVTDNGMPALSVSRTYNMLVIAPSQVEIPPVTPITTPINNTPISIAEIGITTFADTVSLGTINNNPFKEASDSIGIGFLNNSVTSTQEKTNTQTNNSDNQVQTVSTNRNNNGNYIEADASINVNSNGQVTFDKATQDSFSVVGIAIEDMKIENNRLEIKVVDTSVAKNFVVTKADGTALPAGISFDPKTGNISGTVPENLDKLDISIKAINADGTTRVLNIKVDLKKLKEASRADADNYIGLKEQLVAENQKLENYGDYLVSLFA